MASRLPQPDASAGAMLQSTSGRAGRLDPAAKHSRHRCLQLTEDGRKEEG